jgi:D-hexose-6-phosphate mutarotase
MTINELNQRFGVEGAVRFEAGPGGLTKAVLLAGDASAEVYLHGGHVASYRPGQGGEEVLWLSEAGEFAPDRPIRGGVPICWPWFGAHPADEDLPMHGFARLADWTVRGTGGEHGQAALTLGLSSDEATRATWPMDFDLELAVRLGGDLALALTTRNPGPEPMRITEALHTYLSVSDVRQVRIAGLDGVTYADKVEGLARRRQDGPVTFDGEVDRVYLGTRATCVLDDPGPARRVEVAKDGSASTVIWNPHIRKSMEMEDFGNDEWTGMVCIETANALDDAVVVAPGGSHCMTASIRVAG